MKILANKPFFIFLTALIIIGPVSGAIYYVLQNFEPVEYKEDIIPNTTSHLNARLVALPSNHWLKLASPWSLPWKRQAHAGIAFNKKDGNLIIFGSDTHGNNWDNSVHEYDPILEKWSTHQIPSDHLSYRINESNIAISGDKTLSPWAMHSYDGITYDPKTHSLFVISRPENNPKKDKFENAIFPIWTYSLKKHEWNIFENNKRPYPDFSGGAVEYDPIRDTLVAYKDGIWELGPDRKQWTQVLKEKHHKKNFNMEYDLNRKEFVVFGQNGADNILWSYVPGGQPLKKGIWKKYEIQGDLPPIADHYPVAFDSNNDAFLLIAIDEKQASSTMLAERDFNANAYVFDLKTSTFQQIPNSQIFVNKLNYMLTYDKQHKVFLFVTEDSNQQPAVFAFKLNRKNIS